MEVEPEPEPEPVTLLVKSPNQRHRDLELSGDRSWSVGRLKAHLSRVYPERPVRGAPDSRCQRPLPAPLSSPRPSLRPSPLPLQLLFSLRHLSPDSWPSPAHLPWLGSPRSLSYRCRRRLALPSGRHLHVLGHRRLAFPCHLASRCTPAPLLASSPQPGPLPRPLDLASGLSHAAETAV